MIPEQNWDDSMRAKAEQVYQETGQRVTYVLGRIQIRNNAGKIMYVKGVANESGIVVQANHPASTAEQIADHEAFHGMVRAYGRKLTDQMVAKIREQFTEEEWMAVVDKYVDALRGVIDLEDAPSNAELEKRMEMILEEILADAHAVMNSFGAGATQFTDTVNRFLDENHISRRQDQENGVRQTNGPPVQAEKNTADEGGEMYSLSDSNTQKDVTVNYQKTVDAILQGTYTDNSAVLLGYTPDIYQALGMPSLPFVIGPGHVYSTVKTEAEARLENRYSKKMHYHGLGDKEVKNIYKAAQDPLMIIASKDVDPKTTPLRSTHSVVAIVDVGTADKHLLLPVEITAKRTVNGEEMDVNVLSSAYTRKVSELVREAVARENIGEVGVYYIKKGATLPADSGVQFPVHLSNKIASGGIIHSFSEKVNMNISDATQSRQFKRWFGDWQNNPENASKVVNTDGTPKVVYHGSYSNFSIFDGERRKHSGAPKGSHFFTDNADVGYSYTGYKEIAKPGGHAYKGGIYPVYLNLRDPLVINFGGQHWNEKLNGRDVNEWAQYAKDNGYDGLIAENIIDEGDQGDQNWDEANAQVPATDYVVFDPSQIKSATDNIGTFDGSNPDIRYSVEELDEEEYARRQERGYQGKAPTQQELEAERQAWLQKEYNEKNRKKENKPTIAKQELKKTMLSLFSIPEGVKAETGMIIDAYAERLLKNGVLTEEDRTAFFDRMYHAGVMNVPADEYLAQGRSYLLKSRIYVPESVRAEFGDDWERIRHRAFGNGVYLTKDRNDSGIDVWKFGCGIASMNG